MAGVTELLWVLETPVAPGQPHHGCLGVVEGRTGAVQAIGADGVFNHVELLELKEGILEIRSKAYF